MGCHILYELVSSDSGELVCYFLVLKDRLQIRFNFNARLSPMQGEEPVPQDAGRDQPQEAQRSLL